MKAFLLAAGLGTRLRPLTWTVPKCLVPIQGRPLLAWWMDLFEQHRISEILINTNYLPDPVRNFIKEYNQTRGKVKLVESYEKELLGSGGTVLINRNFVENEEDFFICYADNLTNADLSSMMDFHKKNHALLTMGLFHTNNPTGCGIAVYNKEGKITEFVEKPKYPKSDLANAGIYVVNKKIYYYIPNKSFVDFGGDVLPELVGKMYGYPIKEYLLDVGTWPNYEEAQEKWRK